uniref:Doublesex and mab-3 related transcription factor 2 n=1 Tax=Chinchilla lanigera TaxID=34839 RepID=A0A8C2V1C0_CHILA
MAERLAGPGAGDWEIDVESLELEEDGCGPPLLADGDVPGCRLTYSFDHRLVPQSSSKGTNEFAAGPRSPCFYPSRSSALTLLRGDPTLWLHPSTICGRFQPNRWGPQDKKGLSGKQNNFERKALFQRQVRAPSLLAKSILEGYRPITAETYLGGALPLPPPVSDRMRKRRAFADKELENIMLEREYKEREMLETSQAAALFLPNRIVPGPEYSSYKSAYSPTPGELSSKDFCNFLPTCLDLTMQYSGSGNMELISSNVSVATTYRQYPLSSRFLVWPKCGPISDTLLYQQCLLNATTSVQALKPVGSWDLKGTRVPDGFSSEHTMMPPKLESSLVLPHPPEVQTLRSDFQGHQAVPERSAFSPPQRNFSPVVDTDSLAQGPVLTKISKENTRHPLPLKNNPFHSLLQQTLNDKSGPELKTPFVKEAFEETPKKHRECLVKENQKYTFTIDRCAKDLFVAKQVGTKLSVNEPLSFSVESILKRPSSAITHVSQ